MFRSNKAQYADELGPVNFNKYDNQVTSYQVEYVQIMMQGVPQNMGV